MNILLILRSEIVCAIILLLLLGYNRISGVKSEKTFLRVCLCALGHVIFDGITAYTVNNIESVGTAFNYAMHFFMYLFAMCFGCEMFCYIVKNIYSAASLRKWLKFVRLPVLLYVLAMPFLEINYYQGNGTMYSMGSAGVAGFAVAGGYILIGTLLLLKNIRRVENNAAIGILTCNIFGIAVILIQVKVPEFLFTGAAMTIITMGFFFAVENPAVRYMKRAYIDLDTGIKNKNCYLEDMKRFNEKYFSPHKDGERFLCAVCDINGLKAVNDTFGHIEGDELIRAAADVLSRNLQSAYNVYRIGGDEFVAVFIGESRENVEKKIADVKKRCKMYTKLKVPLSIAIGVADSDDEAFTDAFDVISLADKRMYEDKVRMKQNNMYIKEQDD